MIHLCGALLTILILVATLNPRGAYVCRVGKLDSVKVVNSISERLLWKIRIFS